MTLTDFLVVIAIVLVLLPWSVYLSVKLGTFAFYRGRQLFLNHEHEEHHNGPRKT